MQNEETICVHCGEECYWQDTIGKDGQPKVKLFEDGKPHACQPSADDFEALT